MATEAPLYDLVLLLDTTIEQERRDTILANVEDAIDRAGEIVGRHDWGNRHTVYEVRKQSEADYHLIQFRGRHDSSAAGGTPRPAHGRAGRRTVLAPGEGRRRR